MGLATLVIVSAVGFVGFTPATADAETCDGALVGSPNNLYLKDGSTKVALLKIYWNSSTGKNCARLDAYGAGVGNIRGMYLDIRACRTTNDSTCGDSVSNSGPFTQYAGPVRIAARGKCIALYAEVNYKNDQPSDAWGPFHCG